MWLQLQNSFLPHLRLLSRPLRLYHTEKFVYGHRQSQDLSSDGLKRQQEMTEVQLRELSRSRSAQPHLWQYVEAYRRHGHRIAKVNPLQETPEEDVSSIPELNPSVYFTDTSSFNLQKLIYSPANQNNQSLDDVTQHLQRLYCGSVSAEFTHIENPEEREWFANAFENLENNFKLEKKTRIRFAQMMGMSQSLDRFLANKFSTVKRYSGEGAESLLVCVDQLLQASSCDGVKAAVIAIPHRGRNNLLTVLLKYDPMLYFRKMKGKSEFPASFKATGDTFSHYFQSVDLNYAAENGGDIHVSLIPNPSHLEANIPVAVGKTRSKMQTLGDTDYDSEGRLAENSRVGDNVICFQVHGDASVTGQGIVSETLSLAYCPNFRVGGSLHLVVNNQVGYTTQADKGRSYRYCSDVARTLSCPVLHVNGEDPDAVARASQLAIAYRERYRRDVVLDLVCYRRWGHNELDDPSLTQPLMYAKIDGLAPTPDAYLARLVEEGVCSQAEVISLVDEWSHKLANDAKRADECEPELAVFKAQWAGMGPAPAAGLTVYNTGVDVDKLKTIGRRSVSLPDGFNVHPTLQRTFVQRRIDRLVSGEAMDWATAETLAIGSLLNEGHHCRISGQDVGRGTFSQRHWMLVDQTTDDIVIPLNDNPEGEGRLEIAHSILSEEAVLGFELGMSMDDPDNLTIWEAQFGDFFNGAQILLDTYLGSAETKWLQQNGLVMLLPHGYDGAGPEHSSCRIERFLQLTDSKEAELDADDVNIYIINPSTPAQYFHALRRQMVRNYRKPLVVVAPKMLLRSPLATFTLDQLSPGTQFHHLLADPSVQDVSKVDRVILCSGKHFYTLAQHRLTLPEADQKRTALIRLEQLCPFPAVELATELRRFTAAKSFIWAQEEQRNMGAWNFVALRVRNLLGLELSYRGRSELATPAVGIGEMHKAESKDIVTAAFS